MDLQTAILKSESVQFLIILDTSVLLLWFCSILGNGVAQLSQFSQEIVCTAGLHRAQWQGWGTAPSPSLRWTLRKALQQRQNQSSQMARIFQAMRPTDLLARRRQQPATATAEKQARTPQSAGEQHPLPGNDGSQLPAHSPLGDRLSPCFAPKPSIRSVISP